MSRMLCFLFGHHFVEVPVVRMEYCTLIGHRCKRCFVLPRSQEFLQHEEGYIEHPDLLASLEGGE